MGTALSRLCDLECARVVAQGIMKAQLNIEGQKYLTSSMAIPIIEEHRKSLRSTRMHYTTKIPAKKWGDTEIAKRGRSVLVMHARYRSESAGLTLYQRGWTDAG